MSLSGCGVTRYNLEFNKDGFKSQKTSYAEGEKVTVTYDMVATDTDYRFYTDSEDVKLDQKYDSSHGYTFSFTMPAHDVKLSVEAHNSMETDPYANKPGNWTEKGETDSDLDTETWICPECGTENDRRYCSECGYKKPE